MNPKKLLLTLCIAALAAFIFSLSAAASPSWMQRPGTIAHACAQPDGIHVYLDAVIVDKIKARQEPAYFVVREPWASDSRIVVSVKPPSVLRMGFVVDIDGVMGTLATGERTILDARVIGYFNAGGELLQYAKVLKGYLAPTPWQWKAELTDPTVSSASMGRASIWPFEQPTPDPLPPAISYTSIAALIAANSSGANDGAGVKLECNRIVSVGTDGSGAYAIIGEDSAPETLKVYCTTAVNGNQRVNRVIGQVRTVGAEVVIDVDSGPAYDPQGYRGYLETVTAGTIAYAKTLLDGASATISNVTVAADRADFPNVLYVEDAIRISGIRVSCSGSASPTRGAIVNVSGVVSTGADGEREIVAGDAGLVIVTPSGPVPNPWAMNSLALGGAAFNVRTPGVTHPNSSGLSNIGLFVTAWGRVTQVDANSRVMYITDGSDMINGEGLPNGVKVTWTAEGGTYAVPAEGGFVSGLYAISGLESRAAGEYVRVLRVRNIALPSVTAIASGDSVELTWTTQDHTVYRVYRSAAPDGPFAPIATVNAGSYMDSGLANGTYYYRVHSVVGGIEGGPMDPMAVIVGPPPPPPDTFPPVTAITLDGNKVNDWFNTDVAVTLAATDDRGGVMLTEYDFNDEQWVQYSESFTITEEGPRVLRARSVDNANNQEEPPVQEEIKIDKTAPAATISVNGQSRNGWYKGDAQITVSAADADGGSGVQSIEYDFNDGNWQAYTAPFVVNQDGTTVVRGRAKDNAGNVGDAAGQMLKIDNLAPVTMINVAGNLQNGWLNSGAVITLDALDNTGGSGVQSVEFDFNDGIWRPYAGPFTLTDDGIVVVRARATDNAYNQEVPVEQTVKIDISAPITTIGLTGNLQNDWYAGDATVTLMAEDNLGGSGVLVTLYDFNDGNWIPYTGSFTVSQEGTTLVRARSLDVANNEEAAVQQEVRIDKIAPTISISLDGSAQDGWYNSEVAVTLTAEDNAGGSGLQTVEYDFNDDNWRTYNGPFAVNEDGIKVVRARCLDNANNQSAMPQQEVKIDKAPPTTTIALGGTLQNDWYNSDVTVTITPVDQGGSGIARIEYDFNDNNWTVYTAPFQLTQSGSFIVRSRAIDNAGNQGAPVQQLVKIDKLAPTTTFSLSGDLRHGWYVTNVVVTLKGIDNANGSGVQKIEYDLNDNNWRVYTAPFTLDKTTTVRARATDNANNLGPVAQKAISINKSAPVETLKSHFNNKAIGAGNWIWFNSCINLKRNTDIANPVNIWFVNQMIQFSASGIKYEIPVPDALVTFNPGVTTASATYDSENHIWVTTLPAVHRPKAFLSGLAFQLPVGLPGGINPVKWSGQFFTDTPGARVDWKWASVVYTSFTTDYNSLGVKPIGGDDLSDFDNRDHAGTPEFFKQYATDGARGNRGNPFSGQYSGTGHATPYLW
ncbi:MAG: hypothetical protein Q7T82_07655 [Armatimonadota bacterium]|nr:hypothetical protein [Armatimonadota bacterium]